ncbi:3-alpha domain-containing protein [Pontibacillus halophilus]|nr:3-alpha domain-containing protein [Pontibacillus halophilus]
MNELKYRNRNDLKKLQQAVTLEALAPPFKESFQKQLNRIQGTI